MIFVAVGFVSVKVISYWGTPFKILDSVVSWVAVTVVNDGFLGGVW